MKKIALIIALFVGLNSFGQDGVQFGLHVAPAYKLNMSRQKVTGLRSNQGGYGFSIGLPVKYWMNEFTSFNTGINYDYSAFDNFANGVLVASVRFNALEMPLMFNSHLSGNLYGSYGAGVVYNLSVNDLNNVTIGTNVISVANRVQPYLGVGVNNLKEAGNGAIELGVQLRYQIRDIWKNDYAPFEAFNSHLASLDLLFRYYF